MKKLFAMLLAVVMILSLSTVAFAEEAAADVTLKSEEVTTDIVIKAYNVVGSTDENLYPAETLKFTSTPATTNPDDSNLTVADLEVTGNSDQKLTITLPVYTQVGTYTYSIDEVDGNTQGVIYYQGVIEVTVLVTYNYDAEKLDTEIVVTSKSGSDKLDTFTNVYAVGSLVVSKEVTGNLGDRSKKFDITVEFTAEKDVLSAITYTGDKTIAPADWKDGKASVVISLAHGESVQFDNIPANVTYTVTEADYTTGDLNGSAAYDAPVYTYSDSAKKITSGDPDTVTVTNNKETEVNTGITLDSMPYIVILSVAAFGMFVMLTKKRYEV